MEHVTKMETLREEGLEGSSDYIWSPSGIIKQLIDYVLNHREKFTTENIAIFIWYFLI